MKKQCVVFFNCQGGEIMDNLQQSTQFNSIYDIKYIALYNYLQGYKYENENDLIDDHKQIIQNCDLIILQYIKNDRKVIHHDYIKSLLKNNAKIILIPHYTFSGYQFPYDLCNDKFIDENKNKLELEKYINNLFVNDKDKIIDHLNNELKHIKDLDKYSDIKCYRFVKNNYNKYLLFYSRRYPTYNFFHYIAQSILKLINIDEDINAKWSSYASHFTGIIYPNVQKYLNLDFQVRYNYKCNILEYIICCKKNNTNSLNLKKRRNEGRKHCKDMLMIISSKKYR